MMNTRIQVGGAGTMGRRILTAMLAILLAGAPGCDRDELTKGKKFQRPLVCPGDPRCPPPPPMCELSNVKINELMITNVDVLEDENGEFPSWVEMVNVCGDAPVDLSGESLSNSFLDPDPWTFPEGTIMEPNGFLVVFLDGDTENPNDLHADFTLEPESVQLIFGVDFVSFNASVLAEPNSSAGRTPDGEGNFVFLEFATPGAPNSDPGDPPEPSEPLEGEFIRGDVNDDDRVNVTDMSRILDVLFAARPAPDCEDRLDTNDDGRRDVSDVLYLGNALFRRGPAIPQPYPDAGVDPTGDMLVCPAP